MQHDLQKNENGFECRVCGRSWKTKPRISYLCPGVPWYANGTAPEHLKTEAQLRKMKSKPGAPRRAIVEGKMMGRWDLFDVAEAVPLSPEEIATIKEKARQDRYRQCSSCKQEVRREKYDSEYGVCLKCLPALLENRRMAFEREMEEQRKEHQATLVRDCYNAIHWARDLLSRIDWVILDTETTGLDWTAEVISISVIAPDGTSLLETLVKPQEKIPAEASDVNHVTEEMVMNAPTFPDVYDRLCAALDGKLVIAYNADFDQRMISQTARRYDLPRDRIPSDWKCAMLTYAKYVGEWSEYFGSYRWQKLPKGDHTAGGDCLATLELIQRMAASTEEVLESIKIA